LICRHRKRIKTLMSISLWLMKIETIMEVKMEVMKRRKTKEKTRTRIIRVKSKNQSLQVQRDDRLSLWMRVRKILEYLL